MLGGGDHEASTIVDDAQSDSFGSSTIGSFKSAGNSVSSGVSSVRKAHASVVKASESTPALYAFYIFSTMLTIFAAFLLFSIGVLQWINIPNDYTKVDKLSNYILASYMPAFALSLVICEVCAWLKIMRHVSFLFTYLGRGLYVMFCGSLALGIAGDVYFPAALVAGFMVVLIGLFFVFVAFPCRKTQPKAWFGGSKTVYM